MEFSADLFVLRPKDPSRGNDVLFFDVVNRGNKLLLGRFNLARESTDPTIEADFGDGFLMREGYTIVALGWEAGPNNPSVSLYPPTATEGGRPIHGQISNWFIPLSLSRTFDVTSSYWSGLEEYPPLDPADPNYHLTERVGYHGDPLEVPRESWEFGQMVNGEVVYDPRHIFLWTGFKPGYTYELTYETKNPLVIGVGFAAIRDAASYFKFDPEAEVQGRYAYAYGVSQTGRYLRQLIHEGFTIDEHGDRKALDAIFVHAGGASLGSFNERFGQPNDGGFHSQTKFPILYNATRDPATGRVDGLGTRIPDGLHPKVFLYETSSEYWDRGRVTALNHTSMRALLSELDRWVREGELPPASKHLTLSMGTLIDQSEIKFPEIPGIEWPYEVPGGYRSDLPGWLTDNPLPFLVPDVDADRNETSGLLLPEVTEPLGTYTGWAFRSVRAGAPREILMMAGSYVPFARTSAERQEWNDPRPSVEERFRNRADYLRRFEAAAQLLVEEGYLLSEDLQQMVDRGAAHWDWLMEQSPETLRP